MKNICVFLSANDVAEKYSDPAIEFAKLLAANNYNLVWGGTDKGLMKIVSSTVAQNGGKIIGITTEFLKDKRKKDADEMIIAKDLPERKKLFMERSDAIIVMPGGIGTLDEVTEIMEYKKHHMYNKPVIFLNTVNFYEGLKTQMEKMEAEGFLVSSLAELVLFMDTPIEIINYLKNLKQSAF